VERAHAPARTLRKVRPTKDPDDCAIPGKYKVSVVAKETDPSQVDLNIKKPGEGATTAAEKKAKAIVYPQKVAARAAAAAKNLIPAKYNLPETSGLIFGHGSKTPVFG
jgi:rhodanese-related sulfurtransferase